MRGFEENNWPIEERGGWLGGVEVGEKFGVKDVGTAEEEFGEGWKLENGNGEVGVSTYGEEGYTEVGTVLAGTLRVESGINFFSSAFKVSTFAEQCPVVSFMSKLWGSTVPALGLNCKVALKSITPVERRNGIVIPLSEKVHYVILESERASVPREEPSDVPAML